MLLWACQPIQPQEIRIWGFLRIPGEMGLIPPKKWTPSLADECLPHRERDSPRLGEPHIRRVSARSWPTLIYTIANSAVFGRFGAFLGNFRPNNGLSVSFQCYYIITNHILEKNQERFGWFWANEVHFGSKIGTPKLHKIRNRIIRVLRI